MKIYKNLILASSFAAIMLQNINTFAAEKFLPPDPRNACCASLIKRIDAVMSDAISKNKDINSVPIIVCANNTYSYDKCEDVLGLLTILATKKTTLVTVKRLSEMYKIMLRNMPQQYKNAIKDGTVIVVSQHDMPSQLSLAGNNKEFKTWLKSTIDTNWRGFTSSSTNPAFILITEEMVCNRGVPTRGAGNDNNYRRLDQAVHEYAHFVAGKLKAAGLMDVDLELMNIYKKIGLFPKDAPLSKWDYEHFPNDVQKYFSQYTDGVKGGTETKVNLNPKVVQFMQSIFGFLPPTADKLEVCKIR